LRRLSWTDGGMHLNGEPLYLRGVLDQGYWPDSGITPPSDEALRHDVDLAARAGFNLVRKHVKLEDPRWLFWCDRIGMLVWAEPPGPGRFSDTSTQAFEHLTAGMVKRDFNHPSIVIWGAYNEEWGLDWDVDGDVGKQDVVAAAYDLIRALDETRPIVDNSGWSHVKTDLLDWHYYDQTTDGFAKAIRSLLRDRQESLPIFLSEHELRHKPLVARKDADTGQPFMNSEYGGGWNSLARGWHMRWQTQEIRRYKANIGYVYTELYDIENETVGVYTFHRASKDLGGTEPSRVHADTVLIPLVTPLMPGIDVISDQPIAFDLQVAHHSPSEVSGPLTVFWEHARNKPLRLDCKVAPYAVTDPIAVTVPAAGREGLSRLRLQLSDDERGVIAETFVDVCSSGAARRLTSPGSPPLGNAALSPALEHHPAGGEGA
jgi:hypothetical protein